MNPQSSVFAEQKFSKSILENSVNFEGHEIFKNLKWIE